MDFSSCYACHILAELALYTLIKKGTSMLEKSIHAFNDYTELKTTWIEFD